MGEQLQAKVRLELQNPRTFGPEIGTAYFIKSKLTGLFKPLGLRKILSPGFFGLRKILSPGFFGLVAYLLRV